MVSITLGNLVSASHILCLFAKENPKDMRAIGKWKKKKQFYIKLGTPLFVMNQSTTSDHIF